MHLLAPNLLPANELLWANNGPRLLLPIGIKAKWATGRPLHGAAAVAASLALICHVHVRALYVCLLCALRKNMHSLDGFYFLN